MLELKRERANFLKEVANNPYVLGTVLFASLGGFTFGWDQGFIAGVMKMESFGYRFPRIYADASYQGWFVACFLISAWLGSLIITPFVERLGRERSVILFCTIFIIGSCFQTAGSNDAMIFAGRSVAGVGVGALCMVIPLYMSEIAPAQVRGGLVVLQQFSITVGILVTYWVDYGCNFIGGTRCDPDTPYSGGTPNAPTFDPYNDAPNGCTGQKDAAWRIPVGLQMLPAGILLIGMFFAPKSPRWLMQQGREDECLETLAKLRRKSITAEEVVAEFAEIKGEVLFERKIAEEDFSGKSGVTLYFAQYYQILTTKAKLRRVFTGSALMWLQQFVGINALIYFAPTFFAKLGLSSSTTSLLATGVYGIINTLSTIPAVLFIDKFGRRKMLIAGGIGMLIAMCVEAGVVGKYGDTIGDHKPAATAGIFFIYVYCVNFAYSFGPICWLYPSEIFPLGIRSKCMAITTSSAWMSNFIIGLVTPSMMENIKYGTYIFFAGFILIGIFFVYFCVPETRMRSLEEMDEVFGDDQAFQDKQRLAEVTTKVEHDASNEDILKQAHIHEESV